MVFVFLKETSHNKRLIISITVAVLMTAAAVVLICGISKEEKELGFCVDLNETGGVGGFLNQFSLEYRCQKSSRTILLPAKDDETFAQYGDIQSKVGLNILKFSGKRVEERYLKLKNKTDKGKELYAVVYIYRERVIAAHLTTLEQGDDILPVNLFG